MLSCGRSSDVMQTVSLRKLRKATMKSPIRIIRTILPLLIIIFTASFAAHAQEEYAAISKWESFDFAGKSIATADINPLAIEDLKLVRGIVFGKHGRVFKDWDINQYLKTRNWYKP